MPIKARFAVRIIGGDRIEKSAPARSRWGKRVSCLSAPFTRGLVSPPVWIRHTSWPPTRTALRQQASPKTDRRTPGRLWRRLGWSTPCAWRSWGRMIWRASAVAA